MNRPGSMWWLGLGMGKNKESDLRVGMAKEKFLYISTILDWVKI
jgi:hypothetical protein